MLQFQRGGAGQAATVSFRVDDKKPDQTMIDFGVSFLESRNKTLRLDLSPISITTLLWK